MKSLRLAVQHTEETIHPTHAFVCESPHVDREFLLEGRVTGSKRTVLAYVEGDPAGYAAALETSDAVEEYDLTRGEEGFYVYARAPNREADRFLLEAFAPDSVVVVSPVEFRSDATMRLTAVGPPADLSEVRDELADVVDVEVLRIGTYEHGPAGVLTDRQREAIAAAWDVGYYEVPRTGGVEAVADRLDCAVSTASDVLRRAESALVARALGRGNS